MTRSRRYLMFLAALFAFVLAGPLNAQDAPKVTPIPDKLRESFKLDPFYQKCIDYKGYWIFSSAKVSDEALLEARYLVSQMLAERDDIVKALVAAKARFTIMAPTEMTTDVPEQRHMKKDPKTDWDKRARGLGGKITSCGEENLLNLKGDRYRNENILIHEFSHCIHGFGLRAIDKGFNERLRRTYTRAMESGLWKNTYAATNQSEYWAEGVQSYFDCNNPPNKGVHNDINTREKLEKYDPELFKLIDEVFKQSKFRYVRYDKRQAKKEAPVHFLGTDADAAAPPTAKAEPPKVTPPPDAFFDRFKPADREAARIFYKKHIDAKGLSIAAGAEVADEALQRTHHIVTHMLAGRPDILAAMQKACTRLIIIGKDQVYTDMPEYRNHPNPAYQNERVRGTGGLGVTSFGEENLLNLPIDRYDDESIAVHEFCHTIDAALRAIDKGWSKRLGDVYRNALNMGLWKHAYASSNQAEYWAEIAQSYLDSNRVNNWNHNSVGTREQLKLYDPEGYDLCRTTFNFSPENDWRYKPMRLQPSVIAPPARFKIDPYFTKFTFAREFVVLGSKHVSDEALLKANDTIRKMFAYRHDILKALIADGARLVVLGRGEKLSELPELRAAAKKAGFDETRFHDYTPSIKLMVVPEENVLRLPSDGFAGKAMVVSVFAKGLYHVCGTRPAQPIKGPKQQYELRVKRLDVEFDTQLAKLHEARSSTLWRGTPADRDRIAYWAAGVEAYFDAAGAGFPPSGADRPITTREALKMYDAGLYALVDETMAYAEHVDWRFGK